MPTPIPTDIANTIVSRIKAGTYTTPYQIREVVRPKRLFDNALVKHLWCWVTFSGGAPNPEYSHQGNPAAQGWTLTYDCAVWLMPSETSDAILDDIAHYVFTDMVKAITTPNDTWHNWGNKAINSDYAMAMGRSEDGSTPCAILTINAHTRFDETNPYNFRA